MRAQLHPQQKHRGRGALSLWFWGEQPKETIHGKQCAGQHVKSEERCSKSTVFTYLTFLFKKVQN